MLKRDKKFLSLDTILRQMSTKLPAYTLDPDAVLKQSPADTKWRHSVPSYDKVIALFEKHKITNHSPASLEHIVQNIVKNWEKGKLSILFFTHIFYSERIS